MVIEVKDLCHSYRMGNSELKIINNLDFSLEQGKWCCIYGASGSGKTTLLNLLGTLEKPCSGSIIINGQDVSGLSRKAAAGFRGKNIGFIFQSYHLIPELTVLENTAFAGNFAGKKNASAARRETSSRKKSDDVFQRRRFSVNFQKFARFSPSP
jgi:ABC-type lipoprotein export system ATPase subunit